MCVSPLQVVRSYHQCQHKGKAKVVGVSSGVDLHVCLCPAGGQVVTPVPAQGEDEGSWSRQCS